MILFFLISILAGVLTVLAPCILPLLPIVVGTTDGTERKISKRSITVITALAVSVIVFTLLIKATTIFIEIPDSFWAWFSGLIISFLGLAMIFPSIWAKIPFVSKLQTSSNQALGSGLKQNSTKGDMLMGLSLGPVFTTCSPTYLFILATVLPASFSKGIFYLFGFTLGLTVSLLLIAFLGQKIVSKFSSRQNTTEKIKKAFGVLILLVGIAIIGGYDKKLSTYILDSGYGATIRFEENLIEKAEL